MIEYYGGDILFTDATSYINSSDSTIKIFERCSSTYSMAIGGTTTPSDNNTYNLNLLQSELSSLHMNGGSGGEIHFIASTQDGTNSNYIQRW